MVLSQDGRLLATIGEDNALKLFEVTSFDMTCMIKLKFKPLQDGLFMWPSVIIYT